MYVQILPRAPRAGLSYGEGKPVSVQDYIPVRAALLVAVLVIFDGAGSLFGAVTYAAQLITDTYWASAVFALLLLRAYVSFQNEGKNRRS